MYWTLFYNWFDHNHMPEPSFATRLVADVFWFGLYCWLKLLVQHICDQLAGDE